LAGQQIIKVSVLFAHVGNNRIILRYRSLVCQLCRAVMSRVSTVILAVLFLAASANAQRDFAVLQSLASSQQMVVVTASNWIATTGWMRRFERGGQGWQSNGPPFRVVLGRGGLGWGHGLHPDSESGPQKKEGDGRSPAGIFLLPYAFGYAAADSVPEIKLQYVQCTASLECVDDTNSPHYNLFVDRTNVDAVDWKSSEKMRLKDDEYRLGVFVAHDTSPPVPGDGSCVFLHIWKGPDIPTSGCTAMSAGEMEGLLGWLDGQTRPALVQLPEAEYQRFQKAWQLPRIQFTNGPAPSGANSDGAQ
jgi:L,D-peptidoglycan transpeptidase YkuD (ErfK/YbiS/YcfS/YnhG family)